MLQAVQRAVPDTTRNSTKGWVAAGVCLGLAIAVAAVSGQTVRYQFVNFDDDTYVYENPVVRAGLTHESLVYALTSSHGGNWHPLTTLSHILDFQLYGLNPAGHHNYGMALLRQGQTDEAIEQFEAALKSDPNQPDTHSNLGAALLRKGRIEGVLTHYERAVALKPDHAGACNNLAWVLATFPEAAFRNGSRAVELAERANRLSGGANLTVLRTLAAAYAGAGRFAEAMEMAKQALAVAEAQNNSAWANALRDELQLYAARQPLRDTVVRSP
jgi:tetratricopeptide (TPR) repeat protein